MGSRIAVSIASTLKVPLPDTEQSGDDSGHIHHRQTKRVLRVTRRNLSSQAFIRVDTREA